MTARSDELQKGALFAGLAPFFVSEFCHVLGIRGKWQSISCVLPNAPQVERGSLFSCVYFATDICDKQALDFMDLKKCRKTYHLRDRRQKIGGRSFCLVFDDLRNLESLANARAGF